jgi:hypothetical protein
MIMESELESLRSKVAKLRDEAGAMLLGSIFGGVASGFAVQWYFRTHEIRPTDAMIPLIVDGCIFASLSVGMIYVAMVRLRFFLRWKRAEKTRLEKEFFSTRGH